MMFHRSLDHIRDLQIADLLSEELRNRKLVRRVKHYRHGTASFSGISREGQTAEILVIRLVEYDLFHGPEVETVPSHRSALRVVEGILDRKLHIRRSELRHHSTVLKLYHGVDHTLRLHDHLDIVHSHIKKPFRLHDLETFVDHGGTVDGDLRSHGPVRML